MAGRYVHVIATTDAGTRCALRAASGLARDRAAGLMLIVPREVSFGVLSGSANVHPAAVAETYRRLATSVGVDAVVRVCLCRERHRALESLLLAQADVVVGGKRRRWWSSPEERLVRRLAANGHHVVFADVDRGPLEHAS